MFLNYRCDIRIVSNNVVYFISAYALLLCSLQQCTKYNVQHNFEQCAHRARGIAYIHGVGIEFPDAISNRWIDEGKSVV